MQQNTWSIGQESNIVLLGRVDPSVLPFRPYWTGSGVQLRIQCSRLSVELELLGEETDHALWMLATVDGAPVTRFPVEPGKKCYAMLSGMEPTVPHTVAIVRDTQPVGGYPLTTGLLMHAIYSDGILLPPEAPAMTIEFVGDSLTTGEGIVGPQNALEWKTVWMSSYSYSHMVCQALSARRRIISQSGWGVLTSWDNDPNAALPKIYDQVCAVDGAAPVPYDFNREPAHLVVVNLGTNDGSAMASLDGVAAQRQRRREIQAAAENFLRQIRRNNPDAWILWVYGMCGHPLAPTLRRAVENVRAQGDSKVDFLSLPACPRDWNGSREHPGLRNHRAAADKIVRWVRGHMNPQQ